MFYHIAGASIDKGITSLNNLIQYLNLNYLKKIVINYMNFAFFSTCNNLPFSQRIHSGAFVW